MVGAGRGAGEEHSIILAADTLVIAPAPDDRQSGQILGKPVNAAEAVAMLRQLRGHAHTVLTGLAVRAMPCPDLSNPANSNELGQASSTEATALVKTRIIMRDYSDAEIACYVASGLALDKAGAYGIQDRDFRPVDYIDGCYLNVVGLPLCAVASALKQLGLSLPSGPHADGVCRCGNLTDDA